MNRHFLHGELQFPCNNTSVEEEAWQPDLPFHTYTLDSHQYANTRDSPQFISDGAGTPPDCSATSHNVDSSQGFLSPSDPYYFHEHLVHSLGVIAVSLYNNKAYDPSPEQHGQGGSCSLPPIPMMIPQPPYKCGNSQKEWNKKPPIFFFKGGRLGVNIADALDKKFEGIDDRDGFPFGEDCSGITIRMHFPGYPSSTDFEKQLKVLTKSGESGGKSKTKSMQVSTKDYRKPRGPVTRSKLIHEVCKRIRWHIHDLLQNTDMFSFDDKVGNEWRLERWPGFEYMMITGLDNVSDGSWSPVMWIERPQFYQAIASTFS